MTKLVWLGLHFSGTNRAVGSGEKLKSILNTPWAALEYRIQDVHATFYVS